MADPQYQQTNEALKAGVANALKALFPITSDDGAWELDATAVSIDDRRFDGDDLVAKQQARLNRGTRGATVKGDLVLKKNGKAVDRKVVKLGTLPLLDATGAATVSGNDYYAPAAQVRLKPGAYTKEKNDGSIETFIPVQGAALRVWMDPAKGLLKLGYGSTNVSWYAIMNALGASDDDLVRALGGDTRARELVQGNKVANIDRDLDRLYQAMFDRRRDRRLRESGIGRTNVQDPSLLDRATKISTIRSWLEDKKVDEFVTRRTLGQSFTNLSRDFLLAAAYKTLQVQRGDADPVDMDAPEYKSAHGLDDLLPERLAKFKTVLQRDIRKKLGREHLIAKIVPSGWVNVGTTGYFGGLRGFEGGLAHTAETANPLAILSERSKATVTGDGGIQSTHAITENARLFRPTAMNFYDPTHTPEGSMIGVSTHLAANARKRGNTLESGFYKVTNGVMDTSKLVYLTIEEAAEKVIGHPGFWDPQTGKPTDDRVRANVHGEIESVDPKEVEYAVPSGISMFDHTSNAALLLAHTHGNRAMMAGKHLTQALPLVNRELPLMSLKDMKGRDVHERLAATFVVRSKVDGTVTAITKEYITVGKTKHTLYDRYPSQAKVAQHHTPIVKVGDTVKKGQLLAESNYSKDGKLALGVNLRSMYAPWRGAGNFEDAIVVSESAAQTKLVSEHLHREHMEIMPDTKVDAKLYAAQFPTKMSGENMNKLGTDGVIKQGAEVKPGDVLVAAVRKRSMNKQDMTSQDLGRIHKMLLRPYADEALVWEEDFPGTVVRVVRNREQIEVHIRTEEAARVGDKLSMSSAAKGTIAQIIPDDEMPRDAKGRPMEVILNPHGVGGRINPSQTIEQAIGKYVKDGKGSYELANFDTKNHAEEIKKLLEAKGMKHYEEVYDPITGKKLERPVAVGYNYMVKLDHPVRKKFSARGRDGYTLDEAPTTGKGKGGQSFDHLTTYALLGHNAHAILGESYGIRSTKNEDFWHAYQAGEAPPPPKTPFIFDRFRTYLTGAGIDTHQKGNTLHYLPLTDGKIKEMSNGEITNARQLRSKDLAEETGGLFDRSITGGIHGDRWAHLDLGRRIPHPLYEKVIRDLTGLKQAEFVGLIAGTRYLDKKSGKIEEAPGPGRVTGEDAFEFLLKFDTTNKLRDVRNRLRTATGSDKNRLYRTARYLEGLQKTGKSADEAYMTRMVPVLPPKYRSIAELRHGGLRVDPTNTLYRDILLTKGTLSQAEKDGTLPPEDLGRARVALYDSYAALIGVGNPLTKTPDDDVKGILQTIKGKTNKTGLFQSQVTRRRNDYTGRSTIDPDASLGIDEIGIPVDMAWKIFEPMVVRRMAKAGWKPADAMREVQKRGPAAKQALLQEMTERPVLYNRAPSLHRWNAASSMARLTEGKEIKISPMAIGPQNMDFDGDTAAVTVPITEKARLEAHKLLPSRNLFYDRDRSVAYGPEKDVIAGIFALTRKGRMTGKEYDTTDAAIEAFKNNKDSLRMDSIVKVKDRPGRWTIGQLIFFDLIPERFRVGVIFPIDKKKMNTILDRVAREAPAQYNAIARKLTQAGFEHVAQAGGVTATVDELVLDRGKINRLLKAFERDLEQVKDKRNKPDAARDLYEKKYKKELQKELQDHLSKQEIGYKDIAASGSSSKANLDQFQQMMVSPVLVTDIKGKVVPQVIRTAYGSGMHPSDYLLTLPGARAGLVAKSLSTAKPGALAKEIAANMGPIRIEEKDCGTQLGITMKLSEPDVDLLDRHLAKNVSTYHRNDVVTPRMLSDLRKKGIKTLEVRSAMTCKASSPPCQMCAGRTPDGKLHPIGANIGLNYGQAVSERSTQLVLRMFHSGGSIGSGDSMTQGFARLNELLSAPSTVKGQGTLADVNGRVTEKRLAPQGGYTVVIKDSAGKDHKHYVAPGRTVTVKPGDSVKRGDELSDGVFLPQDLAAKRGTLAAQQYVVDEARKAYQAAGQVMRKPVLEVVAAGTMRYIEITNDGGEPDLHVGQTIHENEYEKRRKRNPGILGIPTVPGLRKKPLITSTDMLERMNFQRLEDTLREAPATGGSSDLTGAKSPIPGLAYGISFRHDDKHDELLPLGVK